MTVLAQIDQGTITGTVTDPSGAVVPNAQVTLTENDTGLVLKSVANKGGFYVFSPVKIGNYTVTASAAGFSTASLPGLVLNVNQRLSADLKLQAGNVAQTVTVNSGAAQLLETQQSSTGQVVSSQVINDTPLNGRNYVFIAQLTAGVTQSNGSRGEGKGDFNANGQRAEQNNFVLDGVDNNSNAVDFLNGASFVVKPPPGRVGRVQSADQQLRRAVRPLRGRRDQRLDQERLQRIAWQPVGVLAQRCSGRSGLLREEQAEVPAESVRRYHRRPDHQKPPVFLR